MVLDVNGTLADHGRPIVSAAKRLAALRDELVVHLLSADTFGTADRART